MHTERPCACCRTVRLRAPLVTSGPPLPAAASRTPRTRPPEPPPPRTPRAAVLEQPTK